MYSIISSLLYGAENWRIDQQFETKIKALSNEQMIGEKYIYYGLNI